MTIAATLQATYRTPININIIRPMSQLSSSSLRLWRRARSRLQQQANTKTCQNQITSSQSCTHHVRSISTRAFVSSSTAHGGLLYNCQYNMVNSPLQLPSTISYTMQNNIMPISTSIRSLNDEGTKIQTLGQLDIDEAAALPFKRSKKTRNSTNNRGHGFDDRANAKLDALSSAKIEADVAKAAYQSFDIGDENTLNKEDLHDKWKKSEENLALAYSQAIKYTSRIHNNESATKMAERLLNEWVDRFMKPFGNSSVVSGEAVKDDNNVSEASINKMYLNKKWMVRTINKIMPRLTSCSNDDLKVQEDGSTATITTSSLSTIRIPPPASKDYVNILRAYSLSKARRKGQQAEGIIKNMMKIANTVSYYYDEGNDNWSQDKANDAGMELVTNEDGKQIKRWRMWVNESIPNSKVFALAIKCNAGSTRTESFDRIVLLNDMHGSFADCCKSHITGMYKDDPYVLFHSIKAVKTLQQKQEWDRGQEWLDRMHQFITNSDNGDYFTSQSARGNQQQQQQSNDTVREEKVSTAVESQTTIDVTAAYTTMIRNLATLRGKKGVASKARGILDRMHVVQDTFVNGLEVNEDSQSTLSSTKVYTKINDIPYLITAEDNVMDTSSIDKPKRIAFIQIGVKAYNLVIGLYKDSKNGEDTTKALELLQRMIDAESKAPEDRGGVPLPNKETFELAILSLVNMDDTDKAFEEAARLTQLLQDSESLNLTASAYNAFITVCNRQFYGKSELYDKAISILDKMNDLSKTNPEVSPTPETLALVMKACALSEHNDHEKILKTASDIFSQLKEQETDDKSAVALSDRAYYYMMKCVDMYMFEEEGLALDDDTTTVSTTKQDMIEELFSEACQRGLCSADVLLFFKKHVSEEDFVLTVGKGRLADNWIANIKGPRALYTDGSKGGPGKHARRKGKSTSNYVKKQKEKDAKHESRKKEKEAKKFFKKKKKLMKAT